MPSPTRSATVLLLCLGFLLSFIPAWASEYSEWELLTEKEGIQAYFRYRHDKESTRVQWKVKNTTGKNAWLVSIRDKEYTLKGGGVSKPLAEGTPLRAGRENIFGSDSVNGSVTRISAALNVQWTP